MGTRRRDSEQRLRIRAARDERERETLLPCPACDGSGHRILEQDLHRYRQVQCRWCSGTGCVEPAITSLFARWRRIRAWNVARGFCDG